MSFFVHPLGLCESKAVGDGTRIWAFAHVLPGAKLGRDCNVCDHAYVENGVTVGDRVTLKNGAMLCEGVTLEDDVFIGQQVTFTNDRTPRSKQPFELLPTLVRKGATIGSNAVVLPGLEIGAGAMVGAGSVVTRDVPPGALVVGNPARIVHRDRQAKAFPLEAHRGKGGMLYVGELAGQAPIHAKRFFVLAGLSRTSVRGRHAHRTCDEMLVCVHGSCRVRLHDGTRWKTHTLKNPARGLFIPAMTWIEVHPHSPQTVLVAFASEGYKPQGYIYDFEAFRREKRPAPVRALKKAA